MVRIGKDRGKVTLEQLYYEQSFDTVFVPGRRPVAVFQKSSLLEEVSDMRTEARPAPITPMAPTTAAHRRRRHLSVYHRALRSAKTPEQRAVVAERYRKLFAEGAKAPVAILGPAVTEPTQLRVVPQSVVRLAS